MSLNPVTSKQAPTLSIPILSESRQLNGKFENLFQNIQADQNLDSPVKPICKSKWTGDQFQAIKTIEGDFKQIKLHEKTSFPECLDDLENLVYRLSTVVKNQLANAAVFIPKSLTFATIEYDKTNGVTISTKPNEQGSSVFECPFSKGLKHVLKIDGQEFTKDDSHIVKAAGSLNEICLEIFAQRFARNEAPKAAVALVKMSDDSKEMQKNALKGLTQYCHERICNGNSQEIVAIFNSCLRVVSGLDLINRLNKKIVKLDQNNADKIRAIVTQLPPDCIMVMKLRAVEAISKDKESEAMAEIDFLMQDKQHMAWCRAQIEDWITQYIDKADAKNASKLVHKYLWNPETRSKALDYVHKMIKKNLDTFNTAIDLIDLFLWNNPETRPQALGYVMQMLDSCMKNNFTRITMELIDKYFWADPEKHVMVLNTVMKMLDRCIEKSTDTKTAMELIDKYLWINPEKRDMAHEYVSKLINGIIQSGMTQDIIEVIDKYLMSDPSTNGLGIAYYCNFIMRNLASAGKVAVFKLIPKVQLLVKACINVDNLTDDHRIMVRDYVKVLTCAQADFQIISLLTFIKQKFNDQAFVKELARIFVQGMKTTDPEKAKKVQALFLA